MSAKRRKGLGTSFLAFMGLAAFALLIVTTHCGQKYPLPPIKSEERPEMYVGDTLFVQLSPVWGPSTGYSFSEPQDILVGREPLIYVADTGNDRIVMLDLAGNILGESQTIPHPVALTQDSYLNLIIVNNTNKVFKIDLYAHQHHIWEAPVDTVYEDVDYPYRQFTGVAAIVGRQYYVTVTGPKVSDNAIFLFNSQDELEGPLNLKPGGTGIFSIINPTGITAVNDYSLDFIFTQKGRNYYKVQWITTNIYGYLPKLDPSTTRADLFDAYKFTAPEDVTVDPEGNIYVIDAGSDSLFHFTAGGKELFSFGGSGSGERQFNSPHGVAYFDRTLYVADTGNNRIVRFKLSTDIR